MNFKAMPSKIALTLMLSVLAQPVLAQEEMMVPRSFAEAEKDAFITAGCNPKFIEKVAKAEPTDYEGGQFVLVFTNTMVKNGVELDGAEPLMIGPLTQAATAAEMASLKGRSICNEPF